MFIEFSPTPDKNSKVALNASSLQMIEFNVSEDECEVVARTSDVVYGVFYGDEEDCKFVYLSIVKAIRDNDILLEIQPDGSVYHWPQR